MSGGLDACLQRRIRLEWSRMAGFQRSSRLGGSGGSSTPDSAWPKTGPNEFGRGDGICLSPLPHICKESCKVVISLYKMTVISKQATLSLNKTKGVIYEDQEQYWTQGTPDLQKLHPNFSHKSRSVGFYCE